MIWWVHAYLAAGLLWAIYNQQSRFASRNLEAAKQQGRLLLYFVGFIIAVVIWPVGFITTIIFWVMRR